MKKRILYVITKSNFGGAQRYVYELATALPRDEYEVSVAFGGAGLLKRMLEDAGIRTFTIKSFERDINLTKEVRAMFELAHIIREVRPDVVHLNSAKAGGTGAFVSRLLGVNRIIFTAHGWPFYEPRGHLWRFLVWFFSYLTALLAHTIIVVSEHDLRGARMWGLSHKLTKIHTALPTISFLPREDARAALFPNELIEKHRNDTWLVSTGEHTRNKNLESLLDAVAALDENHRSRIFLTLMSDGELRPQLEERVRVLGLTEHVHFTGFVPDARNYLTAFDIFLMPSYKEGFPYGLLEAGAAGLPVIASRVGGIPEVIEDGKNGLLIDPNDISTITKALVDIERNPEHAEVLANTLRNRVENEFSLTQMRNATQAVYAQE